MNKETKLRIHNITAKATLKFGSEVWVLKKREEQRLEATQMKFLRHLLGITKLDKEKNQWIRGETGAQDIVKEIKQYQEKWLQHVQRIDRNKEKGKAVPLHARSGPEGSRKLRFTDYMTTVQDGGKVVSLTHRLPLPPRNAPGTHFC